jgi:SAM-dependent methyltransferase
VFRQPLIAPASRTIRRWLSGLGRPVVTRLLAHERIVENPYLSAKFFPVQASNPYFILPNAPQAAHSNPDDPLPVPPEELWEGWGPLAEDYLSSGRADVQSMIDIIARAGVDPASLLRIVDVGCASGRMMRFLPFDRPGSHVWGVDIKAKHISWCQQHLSPPFYFAVTTTMPHLPFEDNSFDLVYCGSVFTHMAELADAWFLELRRVLRVGGCAYLTIHDRNSVKILIGKYRQRKDHAPLIETLLELDRRTSVLSSDYAYFAISTEPRSMVFYDADYLARKWSRYARILSVTPEAMDYQTAVLAQKT